MYMNRYIKKSRYHYFIQRQVKHLLFNSDTIIYIRIVRLIVGELSLHVMSAVLNRTEQMHL